MTATASMKVWAFVLFNNDHAELLFRDSTQAYAEAERRQREAKANQMEGQFPSYWHVHEVPFAEDQS